VTHTALPGCTFQLRYLAGTSGTGGTVIGQKVTGMNGVAIWTGLQPGTYIVEEVDPADGYSIINSSETVYLADSGEQSVVTVRFDNSPDGNLLIRKVCSVNPSITLQDAEFKVTYADGTLIGDGNGIYRTDEHGEIRIEGLKPGKSVIVTETRAPAGFIIDTQSQTVQIKEGRTVSLTFKNQPRGKMIIQKRDSVTGDPLPGAEFRVTTAAGCEVGLDGVIGTATLTQNGLFRTDSNGEIRLSNLAPGAYVITETKAPSGYVMDAPSTNVVIGPNGDTQTVIITNTKKGGLIVEKYDSVTKQPLRGATFKITTAAGDLVADNEGLTSSNGLYTTDVNGQIVLSKLLPGTYVVAEEKAPDHYRKDPTPQTVVVNAADTQTLRFYDDPLCTLTILKRDAVTKKPLAKAEFLVRDSEGKAIGPNNGRYITGSDGTVTVTGLEPNATIVVSETKAPSGYILDETPKNIVVRSGVANSLIFDNQPGTTLIIKKFVEGTANEPLSGVAFKVIDGAGAAVGPDDGVYYTDKAGEIVLSGIEPGTTVIAREIKTVDGFVLDGTPQTILIKGGEVQSLTFWNKRDCSLTIFKQSTSKEPLTGAVFHVTDEDGAAIGTNNGRYTTDRNGLITITGLQPGQVIIVTEEKAPNGYVKDATPKTIKIKQDVANSLIFENAKTGSLIINKRSSVDKKTPLEGVTFKITTTGGEFLPDENGKISSNGLYYTDENGQITLKSVVGTLLVTEVATIDGYTISDANRTQTVEVKPDDSQTLYFYNDPLCSLTIKKVDSVTGKPVPNTEFAVKDANGNLIGKYTTGSDGTVTVSGLVSGTALVVTETKVPQGYVLNTTPQTVVVKNGTGNVLTSGVTTGSGSNGWSSGNDLTFENDPTTQLTIEKYLETEAGNQPLKGVTFLVTYSSGKVVGPDNGEYITGEDGRIVIKHLEPGATVIAKEIKVPEGILLDTAPKSIEIKVGDGQTLRFYNKKTGTIVIRKLDKITKLPIAGAEFELTYAEGGYVDDANGHLSTKGRYTTNDAGEIRVPAVGTIIAKEVTPAPGYVIDTTTQVQTVTVNPADTQTLTYYNEPLCSLTLKKLDSVTGKPVPGTEFTLRDGDGNVLGKYTTGSDGTVTVNGLIPGSTVVVTETKVPSNYVLNPIPQTIIMKNGTGNALTSGVTNSSSSNGWSSGNDLTFENDPKTTLTIQKYLETETGNKPLKGVTFLVTDASSAVVGPNNGEYVTDENGRIVIKNLEPGTVITARETKVPEGVLLDTQPKSIEIKTGEGQTLQFVNKQAGTLVIRKLDKVSKTPIAGAEFEVTRAEGGYVDDANGHLSSKGRYTTNDIGEIRLTVTGTVVVKELTPAPGYVIDATTQIQTVKVNPADTQTLIFYNEPLCSLTLTKRDSVTGKPVPGTEFTLKDGDGNVIGRYTTGKDGTVTVTGLIPGSTVVAVETKVPNGYVLDSTPKTIIVKNGTGNSIITGVTGGSTGTTTPGSNTSGGGNNLDFENDPTVTLTIHKYIEGTANEPLAGVAFKVVDGSGAAVGSNGGVHYTNNAGEIVIDSLEHGMVITAQETKTVDGFVLDGTPQSIKIESGKAANLTFWNKRAGSLVIRKLDKQTGKPLANVEFEVMYAEGGFVDTANGHLSSKGLYTTDDHGEIHISGITGTVVVKETRPLPGYTIEPGRESQTVTVNPQETQTLTFYNIPSTSLVIEKYAEGTNEPLKGVTFLVTNSSGAFVGKTNGEYITDENGRIEITGLTPGETITAKEIKGLDGYILDTTPKSIRITEGEAHTLKFYNQKAGGLIVNKVDAVTGAPLVGVKFKITYADGTNVDMDGGKVSSDGIYTTNSEGQIKILGITGTVIATEIETVSGYLIDPNTKSQTVVVNANDTQTITFKNQPTKNLVIQKLVTGTKDQPLAGVEFLITDSSGAYVGPNNGIYKTDQYGRITLSDLKPGTVITAKETKTVDGYVLDSTPQSIEIKAGEGQTLTFYNAPVGGLELIKVSESDQSQRISGVTFEIRKMDGALVDTVTTGDNGRVHVDLDAGDYYVVELKAADGFKIDSTPHYFSIQDGETTTLTVTNAPFSGIIIHKINSVTGEGIYDVKFLLYDENKNPIGEYSTDNEGYIYIDDLTVQGKGKLFIRELEAAPGYELDKEYKTIYVQPGKTVEIEWKNVPITGQFQVYKYAAEYNEVTGTPAGSPLKGAVYEISEVRNGKVVDYITTDARGVAASKPLPLGRYKIVEVTAPPYWKLSGTSFDETLEYSGQIIKVSDYDKPSNLGVTITKRGNAEVLAGSQMRYDFTVANTSNVPLDNFFWHDRIPTDAATAMMLTTGTYSARLNYRILYKTSSGGDYQVLASNLTSTSSYAFNLNAIPTQVGEKVTDIYFDFGKVPVGFQSTTSPTLSVVVSGNVANGYQLMNRADAGGKYQGAWQTAQGYWVTIVRKLDTPSTKLPKTGY